MSAHAFAQEPFRTISIGGPVLPHQVFALVGLSPGEVRALRAMKLFPRAKGTACAPWYPSKQLAAYRWVLHHHVKFAAAVSFAIARRDPAWAREDAVGRAPSMYDYDHPDHPINKAAAPATSKNTRTRFICPDCDVRVWSRGSARLSCLDCNLALLKS